MPNRIAILALAFCCCLAANAFSQAASPGSSDPAGSSNPAGAQAQAAASPADSIASDRAAPAPVNRETSTPAQPSRDASSEEGGHSSKVKTVIIVGVVALAVVGLVVLISSGSGSGSGGGGY